jgi:hypothetical protein
MLYLVREPHFVTVAAMGKLTHDDYASIVPRIEEELAHRGPLRVLIRLGEFRGWTREAFLDELRFDRRHRNDLERVAVVGERMVERVGTQLARTFFRGDVRFFDAGDEERARIWLKEPAGDGLHPRPAAAKLLAASFLLSGGAKIFGAAPMREGFAGWGYSQAFMRAVGVAEVAGAIGLLLPQTQRAAALGLSALMGGAVATHIANHEASKALPAVGMLVAAARLASPPAPPVGSALQ